MSNESSSRGVRLEVFLGYFSDYKTDSYQSEYVENTLSSLGVPHADQDELIEYFRQMLAEIKSETARGAKRVACSDAVAGLSGPELGQVFNAILDFSDAIYEKHAAIASADLAGFGYPEFFDALSSISIGEHHKVVRYRNVDAAQSGGFDSARAVICRDDVSK